MASQPEFPGNLLTNTYILHDFSEIAYIVCTGAIPATLDKNNTIQDANSKQSVLARLRTAEQQFRKESILAVLDAEKLELITFYKKVDVMKDQRTVLTKFGHVSRTNYCTIAYKNACRILELLKPEMARIYKLFSAAVISSLHLQTLQGQKAVSIASELFLLPATETSSSDWLPSSIPQSRWNLHRVDLQIVPGGQLLLAIRNSNWSSLIALTDLFDPDISQIRQATGSTLYLAPTGQLARCLGKWSASLTKNQEDTMQNSGTDSHLARSASRWMEKAKEWIHDRCGSSQSLGSGTVWIEAEIPVLTRKHGADMDERELVWRTVHWPASMCYVFTHDLESTPTREPNVNDQDPLRAAHEWFVNGASALRQAVGSLKGQAEDDPELNNGHLFDDETHFGSPQQFMNLPMQAFVQAQTVYPTPPDGMNAQPTPGFSVDGAAPTPRTLNTHPALLQSSPLATMVEADTAPVQEQAITNFLQHNDDDLFDEIEDEKSDHQTFAEEPNWDFFNAGSVESESMDQAHSESQPHLDTDSRHDKSEAGENCEVSELSALEPDISTPELGMTQALAQESGTTVEGSQQSSIFEYPSSTTPRMQDARSATSRGKDPPPSTTSDREPPAIERLQSTKRRRSSAYDIPPRQVMSQDHKYNTNGKYWFEHNRPSPSTTSVYPVPVPSSRRLSSSSVSSGSTSSQRDNNELDHDRPSSRLWIQYNTRSPSPAQGKVIDDDFDVRDCDSEIQALLEVVSAASGSEPFTMVVPSQYHRRAVPTQQDPNRFSMVVQILADQLTQSSLLRSQPGLHLPATAHSIAFDLSVDNSGSNLTLTSASLGDLIAVQPGNPQVRAGSKIAPLNPPKLRLKQAEKEIAADLSITNFWEVLNLQPINGGKDVLAVCLCPESENYKQGCDTFLTRLGESYAACNLGLHQRASLKGVSDTGLVAWDTTIALSSACEKIGRALATNNHEEDCIVVYMIIPDDDLSLSVTLCDAFVNLYDALNKFRTSHTSELVLQLVPASFVIQDDTLAIPPEDQYADVALEVYHRIPPKDAVSATKMYAPATILQKPINNNLQFELSGKAASPLSKHGQCCHVSYCQSVNKKWLVAAFSDAVGQIALSISYCLTDEYGRPTRPRLDIFRHIFDTSIGLMGRQKRQWWLAVAKVGLYEPNELQEWLFLSNQLEDDRNLLTRTVMLNVELQSRLSFQGSAFASRQGQQPLSQNLQHVLSTPVSTPQAISTTSPEQAIPVTPSTGAGFGASAQTPPDNSLDVGGDGETALTDPLDDSWLVTLAFGLNQTHNFLEVRQALASGFVIKRTAPQGNVPSNMAVLCVNLIAVPRKPASPVSFHEKEEILQDILTQYRGLHTLALARRCIDARGNCVPWHVATAFKGASILGQLL